ncbi:MAG: acyl carrier protein [Blastocatellia bacterium]
MSPPHPFEIVATALRCNPEELTANSSMYHTHGWDSFGHLAVILGMESAYGISIDDASVERYTTMEAIIELYETRFHDGGS